ncbi:hypothetical protein B0H16DRAFT_1738839 [Mycena metata]|uniref:Uncharacterized protein n=1 Tax=Mycena metata TaxID=1033252 RepID=A0AAD7HHM2_9AGAR|nr:hypothetical protein B0H16DRAFT_1738839 [Mycena metata]
MSLTLYRLADIINSLPARPRHLPYSTSRSSSRFFEAISAVVPILSRHRPPSATSAYLILAASVPPSTCPPSPATRWAPYPRRFRSPIALFRVLCLSAAQNRSQGRHVAISSPGP